MIILLSKKYISNKYRKNDSMENKIFELLEKMYTEFSKRFKSIDTDFDAMNKRFENLEKEVQDIKS